MLLQFHIFIKIQESRLGPNVYFFGRAFKIKIF